MFWSAQGGIKICTLSFGLFGPLCARQNPSHDLFMQRKICRQRLPGVLCWTAGHESPDSDLISRPETRIWTATQHTRVHASIPFQCLFLFCFFPPFHFVFVTSVELLFHISACKLLSVSACVWCRETCTHTQLRFVDKGDETSLFLPFPFAAEGCKNILLNTQTKCAKETNKRTQR